MIRPGEGRRGGRRLGKPQRVTEPFGIFTCTSGADAAFAADLGLAEPFGEWLRGVGLGGVALPFAGDFAPFAPPFGFGVGGGASAGGAVAASTPPAGGGASSSSPSLSSNAAKRRAAAAGSMPPSARAASATTLSQPRAAAPPAGRRRRAERSATP